MNHRTLHTLPSHITPWKCDIEGGIIAAREGWRAKGKITLNNNYNSCHYMTRPVSGSERSRGAGAIQGGKRGLASCCRTSRAETMQFLRAGAGQQPSDEDGLSSRDCWSTLSQRWWRAPIAASFHFFRRRRWELLTRSLFLGQSVLNAPASRQRVS